MEHIRYLHISDYSSEHGRFKSTSFKESEDGSGISVVEAACAIATSGDLCAHGRAFYISPYEVTSEPPIYLPLDPDVLFHSCGIVAVPSDSGDGCHRNLTGIDPKVAKKLMQNQLVLNGIKQHVNLDDIWICDDEEPHLVTKEELEVLLEEYIEKLDAQGEE